MVVPVVVVMSSVVVTGYRTVQSPAPAALLPVEQVLKGRYHALTIIPVTMMTRVMTTVKRREREKIGKVRKEKGEIATAMMSMTMVVTMATMATMMMRRRRRIREK